MRPHFKRFFRSMAQKDLLLSDACLPFCGHSLLFFCRRFLFQIKRKCRNAGSIYHLIIVHSEGKKRFLRGFRAAVAAAVRRGRRTLQVAPNRLQISIHQTVLSYYAALYMQKVPADIAVGTFCCFIVVWYAVLFDFIKVPASCCLSPSEPWQAFQVLQGRPLWLPWREPLFFREVPHTSVPSSCRSGHRRASGRC